MVKKKVEKSENKICMPSKDSKDLVHTVLAAVILVLLLTTDDATWANVVVLGAAAVIFLSGLLV